MQAEIEKYKSGWYGLTLGLKTNEIEQLITALQNLKENKNHFHFRSEFGGEDGVGDIEFYYQAEEQKSNLEIEI